MSILNPIQLLQMKRNPRAFVENFVKSNPNMKGIDKLQQAIAMIDDGNQDGLKRLASEICKEAGTSSDMVGSYIKNQFNL